MNRQISITSRKARMVLTLFLPLALLAGCQSTKDQLLAQGYPPVFASGFDDGCVSGRQATGTVGEFRKNVPAYLQDRQYAAGWDDGFRQCQVSSGSNFDHPLNVDSKADRDWKHSKDQSWSKALSKSANRP
ncbi:hypothetical protein SAMN04490186_2115 [Pseudomonas grimontii]|uniref:Lipoprotein n=2 Tax=Pseudomonas grimontii TaxID=129847 RepID=A0ABY0TM47_9PSED|nr:putative lipoprotein [Pseudomonas sp. FH1]SDQ82839.1 hypothetical protein SAMN04490186_2115 [Pseudomonas grimontii]